MSHGRKDKYLSKKEIITLAKFGSTITENRGIIKPIPRVSNKTPIKIKKNIKKVLFLFFLSRR
tara:strand:- start:477 stop:665 length:189 start_codon:yes stop_codon:yes gene_type:complete